MEGSTTRPELAAGVFRDASSRFGRVVVFSLAQLIDFKHIADSPRWDMCDKASLKVQCALKRCNGTMALVPFDDISAAYGCAVPRS